MSKTTKLLQAAKAKINKRANWIKHTFAKNEDGLVVPAHYDTACQFCAVGAINNATQKHFSKAHTLLQEAAKRSGFNGAMELNDHDRTSHPMVLDLYSRAIRASQRLDKKRAKSK
jgi:hypothetical protein